MATAVAVSRFLGATFPRSKLLNSWDPDARTQGFVCSHTPDLNLGHVKVTYNHGGEYAALSARQERVERTYWLHQYQDLLEQNYAVEFVCTERELYLVISDRQPAKTGRVSKEPSGTHQAPDRVDTAAAR